MRVLFAGSPAIAVPSLEVLCSIKEIELVGVLTNSDSAKGRSSALIPTEIGEAAQKLGISPVFKPEKFDSAAREQISAFNFDLLISFAFVRLFGPKFLALFPLGGINIHPSLLPKYRGPSPIQAAILNRDNVTGITIQYLAKEMDCGDILASEQLQLTGMETAGSLSGIVSQRAAFLLPEALKKIVEGGKGRAQDESKVSYCSLISRDDGLIDWRKSALEIEAKIRAFTPWPLCRTIHNRRELFILKADIFNGDYFSEAGGKEVIPGQVLGMDKQNGILIQTGDGILSVTELQYQAKKALFWRDFLNGARDFTGSVLG
jgi:methionyl-tRNA formyltransferase